LSIGLFFELVFKFRRNKVFGLLEFKENFVQFFLDKQYTVPANT